MKYLINRLGSVDDIRCSLKFSHSLEDLESALTDENSKPEPRITVVKMLETSIKRAKKTDNYDRRRKA